ncbi:polyketide synthase dehydratase domain-containing protein [Roseibium salinum]|nr:polyketide synthase dehydratase domain-containing protein [Roseibium salinum]
MRLRGDEPYLTTHTSGEERLVTGLLLPELARAALERLSGIPVRALEQLLWGRPVRINGKPRDIRITAMADPEGLLYRLEADGEEDAPCHLGSVGPEPGEGGRFDASAGALSGHDVSQTFRAFAERCAVHSGQSAPEMAAVTAVHRDGDVLLARLAPPPGPDKDRHGMVFDPYVLDTVWRLTTFRFAGWVADAGPANALAFPLSLEAIRSFAPVGGQGSGQDIGDCAR